MRSILKDSSLISSEEAIEKFKLVPKPRMKEKEIPLDEALGRVISRDIYSPIDLPSFSRSTVDGYAVKSSCTPSSFTLKGKINIGENSKISIDTCEEAVEVDTGAMIPEGADAVVKVEDVEVIEGKIIVKNKVSFGLNVGWIGSDLPAGIKAIRKGTLVSPEVIGLLSAMGKTKVYVFAKPKVTVISTGDELVPPGEELTLGKVYESNMFYLKAALSEDGFEVLNLEQVKDDYEAIKNAISSAVETSDLVITTGGTSAGERDYVYRVINELGQMIFHGIKFKPGKPTFLGLIRGVPVVGLPGNMVSSIMVYRKVVRPASRLLFNAQIKENSTLEAISLIDVKADSKRFTYVPVLLLRKGNEYFALPLKFDSYMIGTFSMAHGYIGLTEGSYVKEGEKIKVEVTSFHDDPVIIGEEDPLLTNLDASVYPLGSYPAIKMLEHNVGDLLVISSLYKKPSHFDLEIKRDLVTNGNGSCVGYDDWVSLSKLVNNPSIKLKYRSLAPRFIGKAKVISNDAFIKGEKIGEEKIYFVALTDKGIDLVKVIKNKIEN
ncbi:gephyrin-like molybdotransferase Glp [Sulfuracidifex metallicus]|uniref:molybdopterin molybdotransferase n=2 Tax=Sulfuracidifex metallicus TaxID=47303 RepID=A0A6A9QW40_SULME|nr:gephyrin-like molybdotransferase Glp [Sulfuracidifex metallicus]MUN29262.1 molybdopterin molybdenumtransferase MoeA [Sulfuracidifex metallicus DSM 6482 = JCM 9184]WOE50220.1 molybdopterin-binding protein [Sulfuracidifex metallicus DSM 6482 = JCM 9184]